MRGIRVVFDNFEAGCAFPRMIFACGVAQGDVEIIDLQQRPGDYGARGGSHGNHNGFWRRTAASTATATPTLREQEALLQCRRIVLLPDSGEVPGRRVTSTALPFAVEEGSPGF